MVDKFPVDNETAKVAVRLLDSLKIGDLVKEPLVPALSEKLMWRLVEHVVDKDAEIWKFESTFCGVPFYSMKAYLAGGTIMSVSFTEGE